MLWVVVNNENNHERFLNLFGGSESLWLFDCETQEEANDAFDEYRKQQSRSPDFIVGIKSLDWVPKDLELQTNIMNTNSFATKALAAAAAATTSVDRYKSVKAFTEQSLGRKLSYSSNSPMTEDEVFFICAKVLEEMMELIVTLPKFHIPSEKQQNDAKEERKREMKIHSKNTLINILLSEKLCRYPGDDHMLNENATNEERIAAQVDALCDMVIYVENGACKKGWNMNDVFTEVHKANMRKRWPEDNTFHRDEMGKVVKPPGWIGPDILKVVKSWSK